MEELIVSFRGRQADRHILPAYSASQSIYGISRSLLIVTNYLSEGRVRRRDFDPSARGYQINLVAQRPGSFEFLFQIIADPAMQAIGHAVAAKVAGDFSVSFIRSIFRRCIGERADQQIEALEEDSTLNSGDLAALVDAIEPAIKAAHTSINHGATNIILINGSDNIVNLDASTKAYVYDSVESGEIQQRLFSIASFNANGFSGRAFDYEEGRTVPFELARNADGHTIAAVMRSMSTYAMRNLNEQTSSAVALEYTETQALDGRVKKMHILKARNEIMELRGG